MTSILSQTTAVGRREGDVFNDAITLGCFPFDTNIVRIAKIDISSGSLMDGISITYVTKDGKQVKADHGGGGGPALPMATPLSSRPPRFYSASQAESACGAISKTKTLSTMCGSSLPTLRQVVCVRKTLWHCWQAQPRQSVCCSGPYHSLRWYNGWERVRLAFLHQRQCWWNDSLRLRTNPVTSYRILAM